MKTRTILERDETSLVCREILFKAGNNENPESGNVVDGSVNNGVDVLSGGEGQEKKREAIFKVEIYLALSVDWICMQEKHIEQTHLIIRVIKLQ